MLLRTSDFNPAFTPRPASSGGSGDFYCAALDESDLTLTGDAKSLSFTATTEYVTSTAYVYVSRADSNASWTRGTSTAGVQCLRVGLRGEFQGTGVRLVSFKKLTFPKRGQRSVAFRAIATQQGLRVYLDLVAMQVSRAQAAVITSRRSRRLRRVSSDGSRASSPNAPRRRCAARGSKAGTAFVAPNLPHMSFQDTA